jgi:hypothetical protein
MPKGWLCDWEGIATMEGRTQRHILVESLLVVYLCVSSLSLMILKRQFLRPYGAK